MNALVPATCAIPAQTAAKAALMRRIEACARTNEDRQDAPRSRQDHAKPQGSARPRHPMPELAAHVLGARGGAPNAAGYGAYDKALSLLKLQSHALDVILD